MSEREIIWYGKRENYEQVVCKLGESPNRVPTAIVLIYTQAGFIVTSDGRATDKNGIVRSEKEQKIFPLENGASWNLAFAMSGLSLLDHGKDITKYVYRTIAAELKRKVERPTNLYDYAKEFVTEAARRLDTELRKTPETPLPQFGTAKPLYVRLHFAGYFQGIPSMTGYEIQFWKDKPREVMLHGSPPSGTQPCEWYVDGSKTIESLLLSKDKNDFEDFKTAGSEKVRTKDSSLSLEEAKQAAEKYIEACNTRKACKLDEHCETIGAPMTPAKITPKGFDWVRDL